jgi:hypothetical protein
MNTEGEMEPNCLVIRLGERLDIKIGGKEVAYLVRSVSHNEIVNLTPFNFKEPPVQIKINNV